MPEAILVRELTRRFGNFTAVDRVSFHVREGESFGFLGPNGAGKTTTIKMLTGLLRPTSGEGWVAGLDITREAKQVRRCIGYMSQRFSLYADLTVGENIALFAGLYGVTTESTGGAGPGGGEVPERAGLKRVRQTEGGRRRFAAGR